MSEDEIYIVKKLADMVLPGGTSSQSFIRDMEFLSMEHPDTVLTTSQTEHIFMLLYTYKHKLPQTYEKFKDNPLCKAKKEQVKRETYEEYLIRIGKSSD